MPKRHDNTIHKLFLRSKTIKAMLSSMTKIRLIIRIEDPKEVLSVDHVHIEKDTVVEETTVVDTIIIGHSVRNNAIFIINLDAGQANIQQKKDNKYTLSINNIPNI